jgi:hypothetical protein
VPAGARAARSPPPAEAIMALDKGEIDLQSKVRIRLDGVVRPTGA